MTFESRMAFLFWMAPKAAVIAFWLIIVIHSVGGIVIVFYFSVYWYTRYIIQAV